MACIELYATGQRSKLSITLKSKDLATHGFQKNSLKPAEAEQNYVCFSSLTSGLESFDHKSTPFDRPWIKAYGPKF